MPPATSNSAAASSSEPAISTASVFTTVNVPSLVTTTVTQGGTAQPTAAPSHSDLPVPAIAGGTAAGVALALLAVVGWTWWGRCLKRRAAKQRKEAVRPPCWASSCIAHSSKLAFLQVRENTRKNASTLSHPASHYRPAVLRHGERGRKVTFAASAPLSSQATLRGMADVKTAAAGKHA